MTSPSPHRKVGSPKDRAQIEDTESIEVQLFLEGIYRKYGYDFRDYSLAHVTRRILSRVSLLGLRNITELLSLVLYDKVAFQKFLLDLSVNVTEMFRDPSYYRALRREVIPVLRTYPFIKVWHAGCSSGEEVYSTAILLSEEGLYDRSQIYATDFNQVVLQQAQDGIFPLASMKGYTTNYLAAGGERSFSDYYTADYDSAVMESRLKQRIVFADHNLVTDGVFGEMQVIVCRNVLIYFNHRLQNRVVGLFAESLCSGGFLCLGLKESLTFMGDRNRFIPVSEPERIFRKVVSPVKPAQLQSDLGQL